MANFCLPDDILHNILVRLPSKPLLRARCVSKRWNRLISEPEFMKLRSRRMIAVSTETLLLHLFDGNLPNTDDNAHSVINISSLFENEEGRRLSVVVGMCKGILLLLLVTIPEGETGSTQRKLILFNPLTRASKPVPDPVSYETSDTISYIMSEAYGFGYGASPNDPKIVKIEVRISWNGQWSTYSVFDLKTSVWSPPQELIPAYTYYVNSTGLFLNRSLYWIANSLEATVILACNVEEMVFSKVDLPPGFRIDTNNCLGSLNEGLCMISRGLAKFHVWVMKEEGVQNTWSKVLSFRTELVSSHRPHCFYIMDDGNLLLMDKNGQLVMYDTSEDLGELLTVVEDVDEFYARGVQYVESLSSPSDM